MPKLRQVGCLLLLVLVGLAAYLAWHEYQRLVREEPERFPWTPLSLADPIGDFTGRKLAALGTQAGHCADLLDAIGSANREVGARRSSEAACGFDQGIELRSATGTALRFTPAKVITSCPVAAALFLWERDVIQPAALQLFGEKIVRIDHFGSYSCRRLYGRSEGAFSEHARANALDIAGFRLASGRRITVLRDWHGTGKDAAFLRRVRDGACDLFATVLSPDYNAAHADHLHFDQAARGVAGWRGCR